MDIATTTTPLQQAKDMSSGSDNATPNVDESADKIRSDEPAEKLEKNIQAKSLTNEVIFTTSNRFCSSTVKNYLPNLM